MNAKKIDFCENLLMAYYLFFSLNFFFRTKIQAQRKFPQGQVPPSSAYLTYNLTASGNETPKEKSPEKELLPNLRPNTEDFLTFLCFRGTSTLPKELDFTNSLSNQPSTSGTASSTRVNSSNNDKKKQDKTEGNNKKKVTNSTSINSNSNNSIKLANNKNDEEAKATSDKEKKNEEGLPQTSTAEKKETKKSFMPFAVRKRAEIHPVRNDKKKAQNSNNKKKQSQNLAQKEHKVEILNDNKESQSEQQRVTRSNPIDEKDYKSSKSLGNNKRRSQNNEESSDSYALHSKNIKLDKSPRIELTPIEKVPIEILKKDSKINVNVKKKIQNSDDVKRQTRLSALRNPVKLMTEKDETSKNDYKVSSSDSEKYFSSSQENDDDDDDDDKPLLKADSKMGSKNKKKIQIDKKNASNSSISKNKRNSKNNATNKLANELQPIVKTSKKKEVEQNIKEKEDVVVAIEANEKLLEKVSKAENNKTIVESTTSLPEKKKVGRKRKTQKVTEKDKDNSQANTTDLSENETRSRPMRKTKEAATIYMELIGRKLTLHDSSDNDSSLDSLEVPNLKRVELLENELKANVGKAKEAEAERKRNEEKKVI